VTEFVSSSLGQTVGLALGLALFPLMIWPLRGLVQDVWQLPMVVQLRPKTGGAIVAATILAIFLVTGWLLGTGHAEGRLLIAAAFGARPALFLIRQVVWSQTPPAVRREAADIRNELAFRLQERTVNFERGWPTFVFDVERARRRAAYEPPPI